MAFIHVYDCYAQRCSCGGSRFYLFSDSFIFKLFSIFVVIMCHERSAKPTWSLITDPSVISYNVVLLNTAISPSKNPETTSAKNTQARKIYWSKHWNTESTWVCGPYTASFSDFFPSLSTSIYFMEEKVAEKEFGRWSANPMCVNRPLVMVLPKHENDIKMYRTQN